MALTPTSFIVGDTPNRDHITWRTYVGDPPEQITEPATDIQAANNVQVPVGLPLDTMMKLTWRVRKWKLTGTVTFNYDIPPVEPTYGYDITSENTRRRRSDWTTGSATITFGADEEHPLVIDNWKKRPTGSAGDEHADVEVAVKAVKETDLFDTASLTRGGFGVATSGGARDRYDVDEVGWDGETIEPETTYATVPRATRTYEISTGVFVPDVILPHYYDKGYASFEFGGEPALMVSTLMPAAFDAGNSYSTAEVSLNIGRFDPPRNHGTKVRRKKQFWKEDLFYPNLHFSMWLTTTTNTRLDNYGHTSDEAIPNDYADIVPENIDMQTRQGTAVLKFRTGPPTITPMETHEWETGPLDIDSNKHEVAGALKIFPNHGGDDSGMFEIPLPRVETDLDWEGIVNGNNVWAGDTGDRTDRVSAITNVVANFELHPHEYWEYKNRQGQPVYDKNTGAQLLDPFA